MSNNNNSLVKSKSKSGQHNSNYRILNTRFRSFRGVCGRIHWLFFYALSHTPLIKRIKGGGFITTLLLKRTGSTMIAGKGTAERMLENSTQNIYEDEDEDINGNTVLSEFNNFTEDEISCLQKFINILNNNKEKDPKYQLLLKLLIGEDWISKGCIVFSQYYDSILWLSQNLSKDLSLHKIGLYAGGDKSGIFENGIFTKKSKEDIKNMVKQRELKLLMGTDAASEGLNLQALGSLINIDLPWNPTRLEQRKGRIQRIGQVHDEIYIYNMRYKGSVKERVHSLLASRFENIYSMFGQLPDCLEDVWIKMALNEKEEAEKIINTIPKYHPFEVKYELNYHNKMENLNWEECEKVLDKLEKKKFLMSGWS